jgi:hypothetical protein
LRRIVVHYHIFKNAGSSVDRILEGAFGDRWATLEGATATSLLRPGDLSAFARERPELQAVSSHLLRPPAPAGLDVLPVVLIRHPLDRAFSVYSQLRRNNGVGGRVDEEVAREKSFPGFVLWCLDNKTLGGMVIADYQVIHLSKASFRGGHIYEAVATEDDLQEALDYLSGGACFGTVDRFEEAMTRLREAAAAASLSIPLMTAAENSTAGRPHELEERVSALSRELGPELHSRYREENQLDYRLYEWASRVDPAHSSCSSAG